RKSLPGCALSGLHSLRNFLPGCALSGLHSLRKFLPGCALSGLHSLRSSLLLDDLFKLSRQVRNLLAHHLHRAVPAAADNDVQFTKTFDFVRIVLAKMAAAALFSFDRSASDRFGNRQEIGQIQGGVPTGVVFTIAFYRYSVCTLSKRCDFVESSD